MNQVLCTRPAPVISVLALAVSLSLSVATPPRGPLAAPPPSTRYETARPARRRDRKGATHGAHPGPHLLGRREG